MARSRTVAAGLLALGLFGLALGAGCATPASVVWDHPASNLAWNGSEIVTCTSGWYEVWRFDPVTGRASSPFTLRRSADDDGGRVRTPVLSPDGTRLALQGEHDVDVYDLASGARRFTIAAHGSDPARVTAVAWGRNLVVSAATDATILLFGADGVQRKTLALPPPAGPTTVGEVAAELVVDFVREQVIPSALRGFLMSDGPPPAYARSLVFVGPDSVAFDGTVHGLAVWRCSEDRFTVLDPGVRLRTVIAASATPGAERIASVEDDRVTVHSLSPRRRVDLDRRFDGVQALALSAGGEFVAVADVGDRAIRLFDGTSGEPVRKFDAVSEFVNALAFSPDGRWLAAATGDAKVRFFELRR